MKDTTDYRYVPGLRYNWLTRWYDPFIKLFFNEEHLRDEFIARMDLKEYGQVLDVGCGTGSLSIKIKLANPKSILTGIDGDPKMLTKAKEKAKRFRLDIDFTESLAEKLPFESGRFDTVVSTLVFHHLPTKIKEVAIREIRRVLKPGGTFLIGDWGEPKSFAERVLFYPVQLLDGFETTTDTVTGRLFQIIRDEFHNGEEIYRKKTLFGILSIYRAIKIKR